MLGPALTHLLHQLDSIPESERTDEQRAIHRELSLLFAAFPAPDPPSTDLGPGWETGFPEPGVKGLLSVMLPDPLLAGKCAQCFRYLPVTTP